jgi:hypothetical protein
MPDFSTLPHAQFAEIAQVIASLKAGKVVPAIKY